MIAELKAAAEWAAKPESMGEAANRFHTLANPATILKLVAVVEAGKRYSKFISELQDTTISAEEGDCLDALRDALKELEK
jgi:hypothetical protein